MMVMNGNHFLKLESDSYWEPSVKHRELLLTAPSNVNGKRIWKREDCPVVSDYLQPRGLQHTRPPCPSPPSKVCPKFMSIASVIPSSHLIFWHPLLLLPSIFPSIRDFSNESAVCIRSPKYWSFSFCINPSKKYSLKIEWFDLLVVQGTFRSLL